jgi:hypothetical protein
MKIYNSIRPVNELLHEIFRNHGGTENTKRETLTACQVAPHRRPEKIKHMGGTVWKVRRLKVMSKESTARLKAMLSGLEKETFGLIISPWKR